MAEQVFNRELGQQEPEAQIEANLSHFGKHYFLYTTLELPIKRGVNYLGKRDRFNTGEMVNRYKVTIKAYEAICKQYSVKRESYLD